MSRVLTIVGASARAAAFSAVRAGYSVHAADLFGDADLRHVCETIQVEQYPAGLTTAIHGPQPGGWIYTGALENYPALVERWSRLRPLFGNSGDVLRGVRQPQTLASALCRAGLLSPAVSLDARQLDGERQWLRKPLASAGGTRVSRCDPRSITDSSATGYYFQELIEGVACSAVYVAARGRAVVLGLTRQLIGIAWTGARDFQYGGSIGPLAVEPAVAQQFAEIGSVLAREFNLIGLLGVDAIVNADGVWPLEVNPRYTASTEILEWSYGTHAIDLHVAACETGVLPQACTQPDGRQYGKAVLFATRPLVIPTDLSPARAFPDDAWPALADIPAVGTTIDAGAPILTILAAGPDERSVLDLLRTQCEQIRSGLAQ